MNLRSATVLAALVVVVSCRHKSSPREQPAEAEPSVEAQPTQKPAPPEPAPSEPDAPTSIDDEIAEALKHIDPIVLYKRVPIPDEENAFPLWLKAIESIPTTEYKEYKKYLKPVLERGASFPTGNAGQRLAEWLAQYETALAFVEQGIKRRRCQFPRVNGFDTELPFLVPLRQLARVKILRAKQFASGGDFPAAAHEIADVLRMGEMVGAGGGCLLNHLVGVVIHEMGLKGAAWLGGQEAVPEQGIAPLVRSLRPRPDAAKGMAVALRAEFTDVFVPVLKGVVKRVAEGESPVGVFFALVDRVGGDRAADSDAIGRALLKLWFDGKRALDPAETVKTAGGYYARIIRSTEIAWRDRDRDIGRDLDRLMEGVTKRFARDNVVGKLLVCLLLPGMEVCVERSLRTRTNRAATRTMLALRLYDLRHGQLPKSLDDLADDGILEAVPVDPFSDEPLRYSRERRVVWSVGPNETDEGGVAEPGSWSRDDFVLRVPVVE